MSGYCKVAVDTRLFQHLRDAGPDGLQPEELSQKTGIETVLLQRMMRHLIAMKMISFSNGRFLGTALSNAFAAENYQQSIRFCYDCARPSFNAGPEYFKKNNYRLPTALNEGAFQAAHGTDFPFFPWLVATEEGKHLHEFDAFMSAYRAGKANWYDPGFYPVAERMIQGFDSNIGDTLLVDVGGGRGHDMELFVKQHTSHPGKVVLQDREEVVANVPKDKLPFQAEAHDFFTPQPIKAARAYSLHSILHDWGDDEGVKILENLKPALKPGYSRVLLNEIVLSEERPTLAATSMDVMMLHHFGFSVRERTECEWREIVARAGLRVLNIYDYPGVAESVIEAELPDPVDGYVNGVNGTS